MRDDKQDKAFNRKLKNRFKEKQNQLPKQAGEMGSSDGQLIVPNLDGYVYVTIGDKTVPVFCSLVAPQRGKKVWVGYTSVESKLYQVLSTRSEKPTGDAIGISGGKHAKSHEWLVHNGGDDPVHINLRAISYLKIGLSTTGGMMIKLNKGFVDSGTEWLHIDEQEIDVSAHIPVTTGKAALVLISIDNTGAVIQTKGDEFNIADIAYALLPYKPAGTIFVSGTVRVYYGQTEVQERKTNTDFTDLRFTGLNWGAGGGSSNSGYAAEVEVDFGADNISEKTFTVTDGNVGAGSFVVAQIKYEQPTGKDLDEVTMDNFDIIINPNAGAFDMRLACLSGTVYGKFWVTYLVK